MIEPSYIRRTLADTDRFATIGEKLFAKIDRIEIAPLPVGYSIQFKCGKDVVMSHRLPVLQVGDVGEVVFDAGPAFFAVTVEER